MQHTLRRKLEKVGSDGFVISYVDLQMHQFIGVKLWYVNLLKEDAIDLKSHGRKLSPKTYKSLESMHANLTIDKAK